MLDFLLVVIALATGGARLEAMDGGAPIPTEVAKPRVAGVEEKAPVAGGEEAPPGYEAPVAEADAPLPYEAEQQVATGRFTTAVEVKPIMAATRANWIAVREFNGQDLVYVTHIWSWRCGLVALHYGVNGAAPEPWPLPDCHEETNAPNAMLPDDGLPYRGYPLGSIETVTVELIFDDLTVERATFNRQGAMIP
ncbi:hypothetical protein [Ponticoccus sp. (in: a-proteobacteria)]|uniref:hypothetical protein n=1 Tax=Ponticoccus sp. (in: a-proteobacteria) TaxID=1925025 RepID=UPI003AB79F4F